eukprot:8149673-Karenia_brevis.AAC.1
MLGRFYREFQRRTPVLFVIDKVRNLEQIQMGGPITKHQKVGNIDLSWGETEKAHEAAAGNVFSYMMGLKAVLHTMALAGSFQAPGKDHGTLFAPLGPLLDHLAACESYALRFSSSRDGSAFSDKEIHIKLKQLDESARAEWA